MSTMKEIEVWLTVAGILMADLFRWLNLRVPPGLERAAAVRSSPGRRMMTSGQLLLPGIAEPHRWEFGDR